MRKPLSQCAQQIFFREKSFPRDFNHSHTRQKQSQVELQVILKVILKVKFAVILKVIFKVFFVVETSTNLQEQKGEIWGDTEGHFQGDTESHLFVPVGLYKFLQEKWLLA